MKKLFAIATLVTALAVPSAAVSSHGNTCANFKYQARTFAKLAEQTDDPVLAAQYAATAAYYQQQYESCKASGH